MASLPYLLRAPDARRRRSTALRRTVSGLALLAGSVSLAAMASPAQAQCAENPANVYTCSGTPDTTQSLTGPTVTITTTPGFTLDTLSNGGGSTFVVNGQGTVGYLDENGSRLAGGGAYFTSDTGDLVLVSNGEIDSDLGLQGLGLETLNGGDINVTWTGHIDNSSGEGVRATGTGDVNLLLSSVHAQDGGVEVSQNGPGGVSLIANGDVTSLNGRGASVTVGAASTDGISLELRGVTAASTGVLTINEGTGATSVIVEGTLTSGGIGVSAFNNTPAGNMSVWTQGVQAGAAGIVASQEGNGSVDVRADGAVVGQGGSGIRVNTGVQATSVTVAAAQDVTGRDWGVLIDHSGSGGVEVTAAGDIVGEQEDGVWVDAGPASGYVTLDLQAVSGDDYGVRVDNSGLGGSVIRAAGPIVSNGTGIHAGNGAGSGELLIDVADVSGVDGAIVAVNDGNSNSFIRTGDLFSNSTALSVDNGATAGGLTVITGGVQGGAAGMSIDNGGAGETRVTATGVVIGVQGLGVSASNSQLGQGLFIDVQAVHGGDGGIGVSHTGTGQVDVRAAGPVTGGGGDGIRVHAGAQSTGVTVTAAAVSAGQNGVSVNNFGTGDTVITTTGTVFGEQQDGIAVNNGQDAGDVMIDATDGLGSTYGISVLNQGSGETWLTVRGVAQGASAGVSLSSLTGGPIAIENLGTISAGMATSSERAAYVSGGAITLNNAGSLIGTVELWGDSALLFNGGAWDSSNGESLFNGADDRVVNPAGGLIFAAGDAVTAETTTWAGLERFDSASGLWLTDGGAGDVLQTSAATIFQAGSTLGVDFGGAASDVFRTEGALEIQPGAALALNQVGALTLNQRYIVAEALQGLTGEFAFDDVFLTAFAGLTDGYTDTEAYVEFAQLRALAEAGLTPNQKAAAGGADSLPDGNTVKDALLMLPSDDIARQAFDQLSGEVHATARTATLEDSRLPRDAVLDRLSEAEGSGAVWVRAFDGRGVSDGDYNAARGEREVRGLMAGVDRAFGGTATVGAAMGVLKSEVDVERRASTAEVESLHGLIYGSVERGAWRVSGGLGYARTATETRREIAFPGFAASPTADYDGSVLQGFIEAGYRMPASGGWAEPFIGLTAVRARSDAFVEDGGPAALSGEGITEDAVISTLGLRFETNRMGPFSVRGMTGWRRTWSDVDPAGLHAFDGGATFEVLGAARSRNAAVARVEAHWRLSPRIGFGLGYDGVLGDGGADHAITGAFKVVF